MYSKSLKYGLLAAALTGTVFWTGKQAFAADTEEKLAEPTTGSAMILNDGDSSGQVIETEEYVTPTEEGEYLDMGFTNVDEGSFLYIRSEATKESEWVGKLYPDCAVHVQGAVGEWIPVESGGVTGYVKSEFLLTGNDAQAKAEELIGEAAARGEAVAKPEETVFAYAQSREAEAAAIAEAQAAEAAAQAAAIQVQLPAGQAVVDFACQFIGNPYVWGGTSLTNGADCSGFVQAVYANFGISMPRTSSQMRSAGVEVSFEQAIPGDVFCYEGHVGIYMGNGQIVNAIDESHGIGISSATYTNIITIRRLV